MGEPLFNLSLITGASSGIGEAIARLLAKKKINLILTGRDEDKLKQLKDELKVFVHVEILALDLTVKEDLDHLVKTIHQLKPDLVFNNAGFGFYGEAISDIYRQIEIIDLNIKALVKITLESVKTLKKANQKGVILNVSSAAAFQIFPGFSTYAASKAFVNSFSVSLDYETKEFNIRILTACPGMVKTKFKQRASSNKFLDQEESLSFSMEPSFAANEIWKQIVKQKTLRIFSFYYRIATFFTKYFLPASFVAKTLYANMRKRAGE